MSSFNNFLEEALLDEVWGAQNYTAPVNLFIGLTTDDPGEAGSFDDEVGGGVGYARYQSTNNLTNWPAATQVGGVAQKQNDEEITFGPATASWGTVEYFFFADGNLVTDNMLAYGPLDTPRAIEEDDTATFAEESITITLD
jgi:hypothetical protein